MQEPPANSRQLLDLVQQEGIVIYKRDDEEKRQVNITEGEVAFFALLASDMLDLAEKYKRDVDEVHQLFFQVSCDRAKLVKLLESKPVEKWQLLEDLAIKERPGSEAYSHVVQIKGPEEVRRRQEFLTF